mmetsp:Transcript_39706/g.46410  ORF Transcript_39706/g.46410 Transcript_39706/m.46410 type:complete len:552 (-) Transcript_39706:255-1910(-)
MSTITAATPTKGVAWAGSLVGINNPDNKLGYRDTSKRFKSSHDDVDPSSLLPSSLVVQFENREGTQLASTMDVPIGSSIDNLADLVDLLKMTPEDKKTPYTFFAKVLDPDTQLTEEIEIPSTGTLSSFLLDHSTISTETILTLLYQPLSIFRVRPISRCTDTLPGHTDAILHVSYSPNGRQLASGGGDTTVRFWDVNTHLPKFTGKGHKNHVLCVSWSPCGTHFASGDFNGKVIIWDPENLKIKGGHRVGIKAHSKWITSMAWQPLHLSTTPVCELLVTASKDALLKLWNVRTQSCLVTMSGHLESIECVKWGAHDLIYSASRDRTIKVWNAKEKGKLCRTLVGHAHRVNTLALNTEYVTRTGPYDHNGKFNNKDDTDTAARSAALAKYQKFCATLNPVELLVSGSDDQTLHLWTPTTKKQPLKRMTGHQQPINHLSYSPDGRYVASASFDKQIKLWNGSTGEYLLSCVGHVGAVYQVSWSPDSRYLVSASKDSTAKLWEVDKETIGRQKRIGARETLPGHADEVYALDWSPSGGGVATGSKDRTIKIWKH